MPKMDAPNVMDPEQDSLQTSVVGFCADPPDSSDPGLTPPHRQDILFAVTEFLGIGSQVPLLLVIDAI
jgi:hypothetical protein